jgi:hypothetical protein
MQYIRDKLHAPLHDMACLLLKHAATTQLLHVVQRLKVTLVRGVRSAEMITTSSRLVFLRWYAAESPAEQSCKSERGHAVDQQHSQQQHSTSRGPIAMHDSQHQQAVANDRYV